MIGKFLKMIFLPKETRAKMDSRPRAAGGQRRRRATTVEPQVAADRDQLLNEAMAVYRKQKGEVYDNLDEATRRQIEEDAAKAFGDALKPKS